MSCSNSVNYKQVNEDFSNVESTADKSEIDSILTKLPKYSDICRVMRMEKISFDEALLLDTKTAELYQNSKETSLAMGMFTADLGYARYFEKVQKCTDILDVVKTLSGKLAVGDDIFSEYVPVIEQNLNNEQVIFGIIDSLLNANTIVPAENEKYGISALFITGFWLETTHLGISCETAKYQHNNESMREHFNILHQINGLLAQLYDNDVIVELKTKMQKLEDSGFNSPTLKNDIETIRNKYIKRL